MNKRIEQLAIEAFFAESTNGDGQKMYTFGEDKMQKFAELIVRECADIAAEHDGLDIYEEIRERMKEMVEDTISRNKKFQEERQARVKRLKELKAPDIIVRTEEMISKMTLAEYEIYCRECEEENKKIKAKYAKSNPVQKSIVDEIYLRESRLPHDYLYHSSDIQFELAIDPLSFMSEEDYENGLYQAFLEHAKEIYRYRFWQRFGVKE